MQAIDTDGKTITLEQDCNCITHKGPHWLHMDAIDKRLNASLLGGGPLQLQEHARLELSRLKSKREKMETLGISRIINSDGDQS